MAAQQQLRGELEHDNVNHFGDEDVFSWHYDAAEEEEINKQNLSFNYGGYVRSGIEENGVNSFSHVTNAVDDEDWP